MKRAPQCSARDGHFGNQGECTGALTLVCLGQPSEGSQRARSRIDTALDLPGCCVNYGQISLIWDPYLVDRDPHVLGVFSIAVTSGSRLRVPMFLGFFP